jgi:hypothetical protein
MATTACSTRSVALELWTSGSAWFSNEQGRKGRIQEGMLADLAVLSHDFFSVTKRDQGDRIGADRGRRRHRVRRRRVHQPGAAADSGAARMVAGAIGAGPLAPCRAASAARNCPAPPVQRSLRRARPPATTRPASRPFRCRTSAASGAPSAAAASRSEVAGAAGLAGAGGGACGGVTPTIRERHAWAEGRPPYMPASVGRAPRARA